MKNKKMRRFNKVVSLVVVLACLLSVVMVPASAATSYNVDTYTLNGTRGYFESNFTCNSDNDVIMFGELKNVAYPTYNGVLELTALTVAGGVNTIKETDIAQTRTVSYTYNSGEDESAYTDPATITEGWIDHRILDSGNSVKAMVWYRGEWSEESQWSNVGIYNEVGLD